MGYQCVDCVAEGHRTARTGTTVAGAAPSGRPVVVPTLIGLNIVVFALTAVQAGNPMYNSMSALFRELSLVPGFVHEGEWWRVLTSGFLHIGPIHLVFNMLALWMLGRDLEIVLGRGRFLALYLASMLGGATAVMLFYGANEQVAGASGAVFGLMGALVVVLRRLRAPAGQVFGIIGLNVLISVVIPGISLIGHLGGLVVGAVATAALVYAPARNRAVVQTGAIGALTAVLALLIWITGF
ncbi:rhomboid family intramembrane serine protease [Pseudonocardia sp. DSM 110487]|uniref:rhomboid family intramembrane serine protease n=1 Tax=Pseudonocardia sp. DSM 110487 TaxID=2865833 RepID=UPI0021024F93|nr:rhomboid family intramembrane serine protease [Pseudonocardia sp. DSM 110487]